MVHVRADQVGSLLRPPELIQAWGQLFAGQLMPQQLQEIEDRAIEAALRQQQRTGIGIYTDGEFRRIVYLTSLAQAVDGFAMGQGDRLPWKATGRDVPLAGEGVAYIQLDAPTYTQFIDPEWDDWFGQHSLDNARLLDEAIAADNAILDAAHAGGAMTGVHLCRGNGMALSPQCGFASDFQGNPITTDDQRRKLELVASVAREVWGGVGAGV